MIAGGVLMSLYGYSSGERIAAMPSTSSLLAFVYLVLFGSILAFRPACTCYATRRPRSPRAMRT